MASAIRESLDRLLALAEVQGFSAKDYLAPGPDPALVRNELDTIGLAGPDELVGFLAWRNVIHVSGSAPLFWETPYWSFDTMLATYRELRRLALDDKEIGGELSWPGSVTWFPVLMTDPAEIVVVECGDVDHGSVWFAFTQAAPFRMYSSLVEAVNAAQDAVTSGAWWFDPSEGIMRAQRDWMPWPGDVDPWSQPRRG